MNRLAIVRSAAVALALLAGASSALGQVGTSITYQGQLKDNGALKNTAVNLELRLFTLATGGVQLGSTVTATTTPVDGLFTVNADFGVDPFTSDTPAFIEVRVRDAGSGAFTVLPRQRLRAAPYSLATRGLAVSASGFVGIGTQSPTDRLTVVQDAYGIVHKSVDGLSDVSTYVDTSGGWIGTARQRPLHFFTGNSFQQVTLSLAGNLGIGTTAPGAKLDVRGNTSVSGDVGIGTLSPTAKLDVVGNANISGNVGIGTTAPQGKLDVRGDLLATNIEIPGSGGLFFGDPLTNTDPLLMFRASSGTDASSIVMVIGDNPGPVGPFTDSFLISTRNSDGSNLQAQFVFNSDGNAFKRGTQPGWGTISDARIKHGVKDLSGALDRLLSLHGKTFYYNDPNAMGAAPGLRTGFIAQEVETVFPDWVGALPDGTKTLTIGGGAFEATTVEAVRELRAEKDGQIAALKAANEALEARLAKLEAALRAGAAAGK